VAAGAVLVLALLAAGPAEAQELSQLILERLTGFMVMSVVVIFVLQVVFVRVGVWLLRLEGGLLRAAGAVLLGGVLGAVLGFVGGIALAMTVPPALQGVAAGGIGFVAGGLGIKLLLRTDLIRGMIVHLAAATATLIVYSLLLIVVY
jgi:hypothetical protein